MNTLGLKFAAIRTSVIPLRVNPTVVKLEKYTMKEKGVDREAAAHKELPYHMTGKAMLDVVSKVKLQNL
jgi:hypothetical protein